MDQGRSEMLSGLTAIQAMCTLRQRRNSPTAVSEGRNGRLKSKIRTGNEEFSRWKMTVAAVQLSGKDFCGHGGRRDADVSLPDMFNFSFSWPRTRFPPWDVCRFL